MNHIDVILNFMYIPVEKAPPEFMQRYHAIMNGQEKLDTVAKLKDFWLFAVEQGWKSYEMREYIAYLASEVAASKTSFTAPTLGDRESNGISLAYLNFCTFDYIGPSPSEDMTDKEYADNCWRQVEESVKAIDPEV